MHGTKLNRRRPAVGPSLISAALLAGAALCGAQTTTGLSWPGCADLQAADFQKVSVPVKHPSSPTKMQIAPDGRIFFASTGGAVWVYDPKAQTTATLANVPVLGGGTAFGLIGIALDPDFLTNDRVFLLYSTKPATAAAGKFFYQLWRYTIVSNRLDLANGIKVLEYEADNGFQVDHSGGGMAFDAQGNLYFSTGENSWWELNYGNVDETRTMYNSLRTAGNANDLRGKVNRIHPEPDGKYTIPAGNLFPPGKDSTRPEIFAMGFRNPWTINFDKATGTLLIADVGPQAVRADKNIGPAGMDEFNATRTAGNFGWPEFMGPNLPYNNYDYAASKPGPFFDPAAPANNSKLNTGIKLLPPARPAAIAYGKDSLNNPWPGFSRGGAVPITGPIYHYDGKNPSKIKLPPHFEGKWFIADATQKWIKAVGLDDQGTKAVSVNTAFPGVSYASTAVYSLIAMDIGPDGALYVSEFGANITYRIEYHGTCLPDVTPMGLARPGQARVAVHADGFLLAPGPEFARGVRLDKGRNGFRLYDAKGTAVWEYRRPGDGKAFSENVTVMVPPEIGPGTVLRGVWQE
ncbi:MAG: hypothetical protein JWO30_4359 [Fibrobacteres bacterium]|nr:hypothetical protein [Fibrobacterota bacterium]